MDQAERNNLRTLANDAVIDLFGSEGRELKLAQALERCVDELDYIAGECETCKFCYVHGDFEADAPLIVEASDVLEIHEKLKTRVAELEEYRQRLLRDAVEIGDDLDNDLGDIVEGVRSEIDELEALVIP